MRDLLPYLKLYKKHWFGLSLGMLLAFATLFASIGLLTLSGWFIAASAVAGLTIARETFNYMLPGAFVRGFAMSRTAGRWGERVVSHNATFKLLTDLRIFFYEKLTPLIPGKVANIRDADLLNRLVADIDAMDHVYLRLISPLVVSVLGIASLTLFLCWFDPVLGLTLGGILLALVLIWPVIFYKLGKLNGQQLTLNKSELRIATLDWLQGHSELVLFGVESRYRDNIDSKQSALMENQAKHARITGLASSLLMLASGLTLVLMLWIAADGVGGRAPDPFIAMIAFATMASFEILMPVAGAFQYLGQTVTSARRLNEIIHADPEVQFVTNETPQPDKFDIQLSDVTFGYEADTPVLNNLDLHVGHGQKVAIVGQTGSGKSTLLQLVTRIWDAQSGQVAIGGLDVKLWSESALRASTSVVSQRVDVLNGSLRDNLTIALPDAEDAQLIDVLEQVGLSKLNEDKGLDTWLGEGGRQLSGGEKRRIGIARAVLRQSPIVLMDEPTEGLDKQTEQQMMQLFDKHFSDKTVIFITHRLVGLEKMDLVCLMEQGQFIETGNHADLIREQGRYYQLCQTL
ncbi:ATP-binding/permease protein cydC [Vibrio nigripulchritudo SFn27]|uniref:Glutathione/L-cysteine transport system ATP-binding/permease protein CydC n=1 Tax=Vibrio nigripulchritudo TaxID=28173 RepID=U4KEF9_9VIBR|nr:cysteine/glutathione ABC transporter ATP-binding protein/permease CydC [Vibrio nigripulchritudo]CCN83649.1 ATP-binding/permease protein cydC [Vibrio nigripulchritudo BLFn1]CCN87346.1 ATP-binding/permease protein cydC [Vibrio nigripulchritudo SFn27]CCN94725.1 ATP-binding/permease protein cydC [Vibrio nigripulchritudo ENn2]CCO40734.1 ATP-binding/permease protein cydC [Vibrio nigripulchritudo SFn135]CCO54811.1 ATP-binding/permease protein cydC [Vibrio nigripulchritudo Wn13]